MQNIIINRLDKIVSQLEDIKANQYALYMELCEANRISKRVSADVSDILSGKKTQSHIDAVCSAATAKNIEALKYIELIK